MESGRDSLLFSAGNGKGNSVQSNTWRTRAHFHLHSKITPKKFTALIYRTNMNYSFLLYSAVIIPDWWGGHKRTKYRDFFDWGHNELKDEENMILMSKMERRRFICGWRVGWIKWHSYDGAKLFWIPQNQHFFIQKRFLAFRKPFDY